MLNMMSKSACINYSPRISLNTIWHVIADNTYHISRNLCDSSEYVALRTLRGNGILQIHNSEFIPLTKDSLIIFKKGSVREYRCVDDGWEFYWMEFYGNEFDIPVTNNCYTVQCDENEAEILCRCFNLLQSNRDISCVMSSSLFSSLLIGWVDQISKVPCQINHDIEKVISYIMKKPYDEISIPSLAIILGMSERNFRSFFKNQTGLSPKEFIVKKKMDACYELIQTTDMQIKDIANMLGFSNQYYFTRIFCKHFGYPPTYIRKYITHV